MSDLDRAAKIRRTEGAPREVTKTHNDLGPPFTDDYFPYTKRQLERCFAQRRYDDHKRAWNTYYQSNTINGYKDRHYILREFVELNTVLQATENRPAEEKQPSVEWMEIGCGVGNAVMPALKEYPALRMCGFDISGVAIGLFKKKAEEEGLSNRVHICVTNLSETDVPDEFRKSLPCSSTGSRGVEFASIIFVLSAVPKTKHVEFLKRSRALMQTGGTLFFRDYFENDMAQKRFSKENKIDDSTFFRADGTLSHFFTAEELEGLFKAAGFELIEGKVVEREVENRKDEKLMQRRWYQARFRCV